MDFERSEYALYVLWQTSIDCPDVQQDLVTRGFTNMALYIIQELSHNINLTAFSLAIVRRLATNPDYKDHMAKSFLHTLLTFVKLFYQTQSKEEDQDLEHHHKLGIAFIYKEILGSLGVLAANQQHREEISQNEGIYYTIMSIRLNLNKPKIIKTGLGVLINLSVMQENKELISTDATYYQLIYQILDTYST
jgi:hypothetical protein